MRRAWIEILILCVVPTQRRSLSMRRAWIEISCLAWKDIFRRVALHAESVDRNSGRTQDRAAEITVALHAESVDRNDLPVAVMVTGNMSLSMRRAWIEII